MEALKKIFVEKIGLSEDHFNIFIKMSHEKVFDKKELFIKEGKVCTIVGFICSGLMRSFVEKDGKEFNTDFYFKDHFVSAYSSLITNLPSEHAIETLTDAKIIYLTKDQLNELVAKDSAWLKFSKFLADFYLIRKCKREISFLKYSAAERLQNMLIDYPEIEQIVSQYHIASYLGIKPESLSRIKMAEFLANRLY